MAEEVQEQQAPGADDIESEDFNWASFFAEADEEPPAAATQAAPPQAEVQSEEAEEEPVEDTTTLRQQIAELQALVKDATQTTTSIVTKNKVTAAVEAWKQQASPAELMMADVLSEATSLEDLQQRASLVKRVSSGTEKLIQGERLKIEQDVQRQFGLPVTPTFQPIPDKELYKQAAEEGDIERAAALALKGFFH